MGITVTPAPRPSALLMTNYFTNPSMEVSTAGWVVQSWGGAGGNGTFSRSTTLGIAGTCALLMQWTAQPTPNPGGAGVRFDDTTWLPGQARAISIIAKYVQNDEDMFIQVYFVDANNNSLGSQTSPATHMPANTWTTIAGAFTAPAGTAKALITFQLLGANVNATLPGHQLIFDAALMVAGDLTTLPQYFDGTYAADGTYTYNWTGAAHASFSEKRGPDPASVLTPLLVMGYDTNRPARNVIHQLLSGNTAASLLPAGSRAGTLRLFFVSLEAAAKAEVYHKAAASWSYADTDNPWMNMIYAVSGQVRVYQDDTRKRGILEIGYRELTF